LAGGDKMEVEGATEVGTRQAENEKLPLSELIDVLNDRFGTGLTEEDRHFFEQIREQAAKDSEVIGFANNNPTDKFLLGIGPKITDLMIERMADKDALVTKFLENEAFQAAAMPYLGQAILDTIAADES
jgi:type I restriction enzyme R subunit